MAGKVCVVTGASAGIGVGIAESLAEAGFKNFALVARRADKLQEVAAKCKALGAKEVLCIPKDLGNLDSCSEVVKETIAKFGRLDVLVNNAAVVNDAKPVSETKTEEFQRVFNLNVTSTFVLTREALPHLRKVKGNVVFISSIGASMSAPGMCAYIPSKAALTSFAKVVAVEEAGHGVRANIVSPGAIPTDMFKSFVGPNMSMEEVKKAAQGTNPLRYIPSGADIGNAVAYLANDATGAFCTGTDIVVDGGALLNFANDPRDK